MLYIIILLFLVFIFLYFFQNKGVPCIMYHSISDEKAINSKNFEEQLELMKNYATFKFEELEEVHCTLPKNSILLTFDDGYKDNYTNAFPLLKKYNMKATIFLNTAYIGTDPEYLNWEEIKEMYESGLIDFQLHTHSHLTVIRKLEIEGFFTEEDKKKKELYREMENIYKIGGLKEYYPVFKKRGETAVKGYKITDKFLEEYNKILKKYESISGEEKEQKLKEEIEQNLLSYIEEYSYEEYKERVERELLANKNMIEKKLDKKAEYFANPWGHRSSELLSILKSLGIKGMITTKKGTNYIHLNMYKIRRYETKTFEQFKRLLFVNRNYILGKLYEIFS